MVDFCVCQSVIEKSADEFCGIILSTLRGHKVERTAEWATADRMPRWNEIVLGLSSRHALGCKHSPLLKNDNRSHKRTVITASAL